MKKPFRWNIEKRNELGSLVNDTPNGIDGEFLNELIKTTSRIIAFSDNSRLFFVGRSPENYFDFLKGIYLNKDEKSDLLNLFQFSGRHLDDDSTNKKSIKNLKEYMNNIDLSPEGILKSERNTVLIDLVYTGSTMRNLISIIREWSTDEKTDWNGIKRKLRIVGITERTKNSPNTWRWHQQAKSIDILDGIQVKNVSVTWKFWSELGNNQSKVTPSNSPEKWDKEQITQPKINEHYLEGLNFAYNLSSLGQNKEIKAKLKNEMQKQNEMKNKWFKEWYNAI